MGSQQLIVNGEPVTTSAATLDVLLAEIGYGDTRVATAVNGDFVAAGKRAAARLTDGDRVEIVSARQGG